MYVAVVLDEILENKLKSGLEVLITSWARRAGTELKTIQVANESENSKRSKENLYSCTANLFPLSSR